MPIIERLRKKLQREHARMLALSNTGDAAATLAAVNKCSALRRTIERARQMQAERAR